MRKCKKSKCALSLIYPYGDNATYACDEECYFSYCDKETKEGYIKSHFAEMIECGFVVK